MERKISMVRLRRIIAAVPSRSPVTQVRTMAIALGLLWAVATAPDVQAVCQTPPQVGVSVSGDLNGQVTAQVTYSFPDTEGAGHRHLSLSVKRDGDTAGAFLGAIQPEQISGVWEVSHSLSCSPPGTYVYTAQAISCGKADLKREATDSYELITQTTGDITYDGPDDLSHGTVTVDYNFPNTSADSHRFLSHRVIDPDGFSGLGPSLHPTQQQGQWIFPFNMACRRSGTYIHEITARHCNGQVVTKTDVAVVQATPTISVSAEGPDPTGNVVVTMDFGFPNTDAPGYRHLQPWIETESGTIAMQGFPPEQQYGQYIFTYNAACFVGELTFVGEVRSCNGETAQARDSVTIDPKPSVSLSYSEQNGGVASVTYDFPNTNHHVQRLLELYIDDAFAGAYEAPSTNGVWSPTVGTCWKKLRVVATACGQRGNDEFTAEDEIEQEDKTKDAVSVALLKVSDTDIQATITWHDVIAGGTIKLELQNWTNPAGQEIPGGPLTTFTATTASGTHVFTFSRPPGARQLKVLATAPTACGPATDDAWIECGCEDATLNPVYWSDGNMRLTDGEPLPAIGGHGLTRTYDSDEQLGGLFGRGWTTLFEQRLITHDDGAISILSATNEAVTFRPAAGSFRQTWPRSQSPGTLAHDAAAGTFTYRAPGSTETAIFRAADGRLLTLRDAANAREAVIAYDAQGRPSTFTDAVTGVTWNLTINAQRRVTSIGVASHPELTWTYSYDANGNLLSVFAPGNAVWRTYEYENDWMTASYDALGNLIESHTYDAEGRAITSTGDGDEIANIEYGLPGATAGERVTRVTYKTGATAEYALRAVGGAWRAVSVRGSCASCGADEATYVRDTQGRAIRQQGADGYIQATTYAGDRVQSRERALKPAGCDPQTDPQRCRLGPDALATALLEPTAATVETTYEYSDSRWPDRITARTTPSVRAPANQRREEYTYHPVTGAGNSATVRGWADEEEPEIDRVTRTSFYGDVPACGQEPCPPSDPHAPAFAPGGSFQSAWLALPQPSHLPKAIDGSRTDVQDITARVYYPIDASVPALLRGRLAATKNAAGHITRYEGYDVFGNVTRIVDPNGVVTEMTFDTLGRLSTSTTRGVAGCNTTDDPLCATDLTVTRAYASVVGPLRLERAPGGGVTVYTYDARGRVQTISRGPSESDLREQIETSYDALTGKKSIERTLAREAGTWVEKRRQSFSYDGQARLQTVTHADGAAIHYTYDSADRLAGVRDENHAAPNTLYAYDPAGRMATVTQTLANAPGGVITTRYSYDTHDNLTTVTDPNGNVTSYVYDDFGQMASQHSPVTGTTAYAYDTAGNPTQVVDANGAVTTRTYDVLNRVTTATSTLAPVSEVVSWSYDDPTTGRFAIGRLATMGDPSGLTAYSYDRRGLLRLETHAMLDSTFVQTYGYDANGNRTSIGYPSGRVVTYVFDNAGRPIAATGTAAGQVTPYVTGAAYLPFGPMTSLTLGNGTTETRTYNTRYLPLANRLAYGATTIAHYTHQTDPAGNITAITDLMQPTYSRTFGYDDLHRLTVANTGASLWGTGSYSYDRMGNMLSATLGGNPRTFSHQGTTPRIATATGLGGSMAYDAAGNELKSPAGDPEDGSPAASYSPRNLLQSQFVRAYDRCYEEQGSACIQPDPVQEWRSNVYDGRGVRVQSTRTIISLGSITIEDPPPAELFFYTPELKMLNVVSPTYGRVADVIWFGSRPVADHDESTVRYTFTDHLDTPILQTVSNGAVVWRVEYEPFGNVYALRAGDAADDQPLRFPGQQVAYNTGSGEETYNVFRWYRSGWGRYTQADPIGIHGGLNLYAYVNGQPTAHTDRFGLAGDLAMETISPVAQLLAHLLDTFYEDIQKRRADGHQRFPGEENSRMRHCTVSCEAAQFWGKPLVRFAGGANEIQGFVRWDILNIWSRITGKSPWAFQFDDLANNEQGFACVDRLASGNDKQCTTCEECCAGKCCGNK